MPHFDELEQWWRALCDDLSNNEKKHAGYTKRLLSIGLPDVLWTYLDEIARYSYGLDADELFSRMVISFAVLTLDDKGLQKSKTLPIENAIEILKDMIKEGKLKSKQITIG